MITRFLYESLRNETHAAYHDAVMAIFGSHPDLPGIESQFAAYQTAYNDEILALDVVRRSELTAQIAEQDTVRDSVYRGFADSVKGATKHFDSVKRSAAMQLQNMLTAYGNIAIRPLDEETAAIDDLLREVETRHTKSIELLGLEDWITQLANENSVFKALILDRNSETAQRPAVKMKTSRAAVDAAFRALLNMLDALILVNGEAPYQSFLTEFNTLSERYKTILAQEQGMRKKKKEPIDNN
ncbi:MAG: DUF6261 family protein [Tannerella sp.]|jgi:hypothetical protein|nr:DUF6261 family protein [Tannerella sp.]